MMTIIMLMTPYRKKGCCSIDSQTYLYIKNFVKREMQMKINGVLFWIRDLLFVEVTVPREVKKLNATKKNRMQQQIPHTGLNAARFGMTT